jgi:2-keto-4-pentenoate hydratase/2-oxohepta-3-ene-1,7-dioic acid hydratase in catechol pathway
MVQILIHFRIPQLIEHISAIMTLEEGDLILTGTPSGGTRFACFVDMSSWTDSSWTDCGSGNHWNNRGKVFGHWKRIQS